MTIISDPGTALAGPALRMHLLELFLDAADFPDQVLPLAQAAEAWITGNVVSDPEEDPDDQPAQTSLAPGGTGGDTEVHGGGQSAEGGDLQLEPGGESDDGGAFREPGDPAPENSAGPEGSAGADPVEPAARRSWTEAEEHELERLAASGMLYAEIAQRLDRTLGGINMRVSETGINKRWPRSRGGKVMFTPYPLDAPWPPPETVAVPARGDRKQELIGLYEAGFEIREIAEKTGLAVNSVSARATSYGMTRVWRQARERRRAEQAMAAPKADMVHIDPSVDITIPVAAVVAAPLPPQPPTDDKIAAALEADRPSIPVQAPLTQEERERMIETHAKSKGVITKVDFGPDQRAVDVLRAAFNDVVKSNDPRAPWLVNGARRNTQQLWDQANRELRQRGQKPIKRGG